MRRTLWNLSRNFKQVKHKAHKLVKMTANMQAGDLPIDSNFENMPPAGRELI